MSLQVSILLLAMHMIQLASSIPQAAIALKGDFHFDFHVEFEPEGCNKSEVAIQEPTTTTTKEPTTATNGILSCDEANIQANIARPKTRKLVEDGGITLAFVFDTTGSMSSDLQQVKNGAKKILNATLHSSSSPIQNFILVEFNDPDVGPLTKTTDPAKFETSINDIVVSGGGDCPEMALGGIIMALEAVLPNSVIYVFTDASAKDKDKLGEVTSLIQEKSVQVDILLTGPNCYEKNDTTYETVASTSSGQVYTINKGDVAVILDYITDFVSTVQVILIAIEFEAGENYFDLIVDATLKEFTVSVSGSNPFIQIFGPGGEDLEKIGKVVVFVDLTNVKIVGVMDPTPGKHSVNVSSDSTYTVRARGDTSISFKYGFSLTPTVNFEETSLIPKGGETSYIIVKPTELTDFGDLYRIQMIIKNGTIVHDSSLKLIPGYDSIYNGTDFTPPIESFQIKIYGCDQIGNEFERLSASYISALFPASKIVFTSDNSKSSPNKPHLEYPQSQIYQDKQH